MIDTLDEEMIKEFTMQHLKNYKSALKEIIKNNTNGLVDEDIASLIKEPPLDSMDTIKSKLISLGKSSKIVLDSNNLSEILSTYRNSLLERIAFIKDIRIEDLCSKVDNFMPERDTEVLQIKTKDMESINKDVKKQLRKIITEEIKKLVDELNCIYKSDTDNDKKEQINNNFSKYMKKTYQKQLLESIAIKTMVKDRTLINGVAEQGERFLFTKANSHIFKEEVKSARK